MYNNERHSLFYFISFTTLCVPLTGLGAKRVRREGGRKKGMENIGTSRCVPQIYILNPNL